MKKHFTAALVAVTALLMSAAPIALAAADNGIAYTSTQAVLIDGSSVTFQAYALKDANGNDTNYVKIRDVADALDGTAAQFNVGWDNAVNIETGKPYNTRNGQEGTTPYTGDRAYTKSASATKLNGTEVNLDAITLTDDNGGGYTYYKLRDLGDVVGFNVDWSAEKGIYIETNNSNFNTSINTSSEFTLSHKGLTMQRGESVTITAIISPVLQASTIEWESFSRDGSGFIQIDDLGTTTKDGKTVASARVTALKPGSETVYCWLRHSDKSEVLTCRITIPLIMKFYDDFPDIPNYAWVTGAEEIGSYKATRIFRMEGKTEYANTLLNLGYRRLSFLDRAATYTIEGYKYKAPIESYKNSAGTVVHLMEGFGGVAAIATDGIMESDAIFKYINQDAIIAQRPVSDSPYANDKSNYKYGYVESGFSIPIYEQKENIDSTGDLERFLKNKYKIVSSPMGDLQIEINNIGGVIDFKGDGSITVHVSFGYVDMDDMSVITPMNLATHAKFSPEEISETIDIIQEMLQFISQDCIDCFPGITVNGSIFSSGYHYRHIKVDYYSHQTLSWKQTGSTFKWCPDLDDYDITKGF